MKRLFTAATVAIFIVPVGSAIGKPVTKEHRHAYEQAYKKVQHKFGKRTPGCHLFRTCHIRITDEKVVKSTSVLKRMLTPPPVYSGSFSSSTPTQVAQGTYTSSYPVGPLGKLSSIRSCESGGNYSTNTGNGFYGAYQFTLRTWHSVGGVGNPADASPAEQDKRASMLYNDGKGAGNWPVCAYR